MADHWDDLPYDYGENAATKGCAYGVLIGLIICIPFWAAIAGLFWWLAIR